MKTQLHIFLALFTICTLGARGQTSYFKVVPNSISMEVKREGGDSLTLFYRAVYLDSSGNPFTGEVYTMYNTQKNKTPGTCQQVYRTGSGELRVETPLNVSRQLHGR